MARVRMITRTIELNKVAVMVCDTKEAKVETMFFELTGHYDNNNDIIMEVQSILDETGKEYKKAIMVNTNTIIEKLYGMPERDFIKYAKEMESRVKVG